MRYNTTVMSRGIRTDPWFYYMEDVPYTLYFNDHMALHGAYWHDEFGYVRSHGCVNVLAADAQWVYRWSMPVAEYDEALLVVEEGGTPVIVSA